MDLYDTGECGTGVDGFGSRFLPVDRDADSVSMLRGLSARESHTREDTARQCRSMFQVWFYGLGSPPTMSEGAAFLDGQPGDWCCDPTLRCHIEEQLPELMRLAKAAPLLDTREKAEGLLEFVETSLRMRLPRPSSLGARVSEFIPECQLIPLLPDGQQLQVGDCGTGGGDNCCEGSGHDLDAELMETAQSLLADQFHDWHRVGNAFHVMAYHPHYLEIFMQFHNSLLRGAGPIGVSERHFLAIMAASRHRCAHLAHLHAIEFLHLNGDPAWLSQGLSGAPAKIRKLACLCRMLAHRPWDLTSDSLRPLLAGPDSLSQSELVHAMCLFSHFLALAGFVAGTGVGPELDSPLGFTYRSESGEQQWMGTAAAAAGHSWTGQQLGCSNGGVGHYKAATTATAGGTPAPSSPGLDPKHRVQELLNAIKDIDESSEVAQPLPEDQAILRFERIEQETAGIVEQKFLALEQRRVAMHQVCRELAEFCDDPKFEYKDFLASKSDCKQLRSFRVQDFSWEEDASCLVDRYMPSLSCELNDRFETSFNLTYGTMGSNKNVQTAPFRLAVWYYIHSIFGLRHDDYDYSLINRMLSMDLKKYCKLVACWPDQVTAEQYKTAMPGFKHSEKVHVNLVIMDSRLQAMVLYCLRALTNLMTGQ